MTVKKKQLQEFLKTRIPRKIPGKIRRAAIRHTTVSSSIWVGIIMIAISIPLIYFMSPLEMQQDVQLDVARPLVVTGKITRIEKTNMSKGSRGNKLLIYRYFFAFKHRDQDYTGFCYLPGKKMNSGQIVKIEFIENNPAVNRITGCNAAPFGYSSLVVGILPLLGLVFIIYGLVKRAAIIKLLANGISTCGLVTAVKATSTRINNRRRYKVMVNFQYNGDYFTATVNAYGVDAFMAQQKLSHHDRVNLLFDRNNPQKVIMIEKVVVD
ncbi:DUF3592 domain-containing protein [Lentisphaerota bacterium ZTH]|nr:DUF3592 domain-containing protein [Lentisphaerota bacterium]WET05404.1 DUF3592 domain-containing protein [Lentisphaerota bacterium ZTH]